MGLFSNKNNQLIASQHLKIVQDCVRIVNTTKKPDIFFERYSLLEQKLNALTQLSGVRYSGTSPRNMLKQIIDKKQAAIHDMVERYWNDVILKTQNLKTEKAKQNTYYTFITSLEPYYSKMDNSNVDYIKKLYESVASEEYEKRKNSTSKKTISVKYEERDISLTAEQLETAKTDISNLNNLLKANKYTAKLKMDPSKITSDSYIRLTPYTEKTGRPSKYPKMACICSTVYNGYTVCLYYNQKGVIGKGNIIISTFKYSYTIDLKAIDNQLCIMKVIATDRNCNNETLFHIKADGTVYKK